MTTNGRRWNAGRAVAEDDRVSARGGLTRGATGRSITAPAMKAMSALALCASALVGCATPARMIPREFAPLGMYANPVVERDTPDPFVMEYGGVYYCYATESGVPGFQVLESTDLVAWTHRGVALVPAWSDGHHWAPEVVARDDGFWMFYSARNRRSSEHDLAAAWSRSPTGAFEHRAVLVETPHASAAATGRGPGTAASSAMAKGSSDSPASPDEFERRGAIDAHVFTDVDGRQYLLYSQEWPRRLVLRELASDMTTLIGKPVDLIEPDQAWEMGVVEAPAMVRRDGVYHLFYSGGAFEGRKGGSLYGVGHASASGVRGPYVKTGEPILSSVAGETYGPGHVCVLTVDCGGVHGGGPRANTTHAGDSGAAGWTEDWLIYHAWDAGGEPKYGDDPENNLLGRTLRIDRLRWRDGMPVIDGPSVEARGKPCSMRGR
jgi:beta-xylosidase